MKSFISILIILILLLCGCESAPTVDSTDEDGTSVGSVATGEAFTDNDYLTEYDGGTEILLKGDGIECDSDSVSIDGTQAIITADGTYIISGELKNGAIIIDCPATAKPRIILNGVSITSESFCPIYIKNSEKVFITLGTGSKNALTNGGVFEPIDESNVDAVIFSKQDLTVNGDGELTVSSPAGHGIVSNDDLVLTGGSINITSASHGLKANDSIRITGASVNAVTGKDGLHAEDNDDTTRGYVYVKSGVFTLDTQGDGISAATTLQIEDGAFEIVTGGGAANASKQTSDGWGEFAPDGWGGHGGKNPMRPTSTLTDSTDTADSTSIKAIKSSGDMIINGGTFKIDSADDSIHSNAAVTVNGGIFEIASGDDGIHADRTLTITDCDINVSESYEGIEGLDIAVSGGRITLVASDDGFNAAGGNDSSGFGGMREDDTFGGPNGMGRPNGMGGHGMGASNGSIVISGGEISVTASGDGIDANGTLEITGGHVTVSGPNKGDTATLDYDLDAVISGGTFIGTGASGMAQSFSQNEQGVIAVSVGSQAANTLITVKDKSGNAIISYAPELEFSVVIISAPEIKSGDTYSITVGENSGDITAE